MSKKLVGIVKLSAIPPARNDGILSEIRSRRCLLQQRGGLNAKSYFGRIDFLTAIDYNIINK